MVSGDALQPWGFGDKVEEICKAALARRMRLTPYLYTLMHEAHLTGVPICRRKRMSYDTRMSHFACHVRCSMPHAPCHVSVLYALCHIAR